MARGRVYKIYASVTASIDAAAYITVQRNCRLSGIMIQATPNGVTTADSIQLEVSTAAARQLTTNDTQGPLTSVGSVAVAIGGAGGFISGINQHVPIDYDLKEGDRIYLHATEAGSGTWTCNVYLNVSETGRK